MKFSKPALTLLTSAVLVGLVACREEVVSDVNNVEEAQRQAELAANQPRVPSPGTAPMPSQQTPSQSVPSQATQANDRTQSLPTARQSDLATNALESGAIPEELTANDSGLNRLAIARLEPTAGNQTSGYVSFSEIEGEEGMRIVARIVGLADGEHGIHVHEVGDCSASDASSAGGHLNPENEQHAAPGEETHHAGDLGNVTAIGQAASLDITDEELSFTGMNSLAGKAIIVHAGRDDLTSQPGGNSGDPVACGVIEMQDANALSRN